METQKSPLSNERGLGVEVCYILLRRLYQTIMDYMAYQQQKFIYHSSEGWKIQGPWAGKFTVRKAYFHVLGLSDALLAFVVL